MPRILVIGGSGLVGQAVIREFGTRHSVRGTCYNRSSASCLKCDITDTQSLKEVFDYENFHPTHVVNCSSLSGGVDFCEKNPAGAEKFYVQGTMNLGNLCLEYGSRFISLSSECVFDGKQEIYGEEDVPSPLNVYGECKVRAEEWLRQNVPNSAVVRTMSVFGWQPDTATPNAVMSLYFSLCQKKKVFVSSLRWGTPTYVRDLARALVEISLSEEKGIYHVVGGSYLNRYEWLKKTCEALDWDSSLVVPQEKLSRDEVPRPLRVRLETKKFRKRFKTVLHPLPEALEILRRDIQGISS